MSYRQINYMWRSLCLFFLIFSVAPVIHIHKSWSNKYEKAVLLLSSKKKKMRHFVRHVFVFWLFKTLEENLVFDNCVGVNELGNRSFQGCYLNIELIWDICQSLQKLQWKGSSKKSLKMILWSGVNFVINRLPLRLLVNFLISKSPDTIHKTLLPFGSNEKLPEVSSCLYQ